MELTTEQARQEWIAALRSGDFEQGKGRLCQMVDGVAKYCCLGIACELFYDRLGLVKKERTAYSNDIAYDDRIALLPLPIARLLKINEHGNCLTGKGPSLPELNDDSGYTFDQIADELETGKYWGEDE